MIFKLKVLIDKDGYVKPNVKLTDADYITQTFAFNHIFMFDVNPIFMEEHLIALAELHGWELEMIHESIT